MRCPRGETRGEPPRQGGGLEGKRKGRRRGGRREGNGTKRLRRRSDTKAEPSRGQDGALPAQAPAEHGRESISQAPSPTGRAGQPRRLSCLHPPPPAPPHRPRPGPRHLLESRAVRESPVRRAGRRGDPPPPAALPSRPGPARLGSSRRGGRPSLFPPPPPSEVTSPPPPPLPTAATPPRPPPRRAHAPQPHLPGGTGWEGGWYRGASWDM